MQALSPERSEGTEESMLFREEILRYRSDAAPSASLRAGSEPVEGMTKTKFIITEFRLLNFKT